MVEIVFMRPESLGLSGMALMGGHDSFVPRGISRLPSHLLRANWSRGEGLCLDDGEAAQLVFKSSVYFCYSTLFSLVCGSCVLNDCLLLNPPVSVPVS